MNAAYKILRWAPGVAALGLLFVNGYATLNCRKPAGCVDPYWSSFWIISYSDGYERRALIGQAMRFLFGAEISYQALNSCAILLCCASLLSFWLLVWRPLFQTNRGRLLLVAVISGPPSVLMLEVLGDPLTACLLLALLFLVVTRHVEGWALYMTAAAVFLALLAIHEASAFLFVPFLVLSLSFSLGRRPPILVAILVMIASVVVFVVLLNAQPSQQPSMAIVSRAGDFYYGDSEKLPSFGVLLRQELTSYLRLPDGPPRFVIRFLGALLWPAIILLAASHALRNAGALRIFLFLLLAASPLFVIAHDWGRFGIYLLILSLCLSVCYPDAPLDSLPGAKIVARLIQGTRAIFRSASVYGCLPLLYVAGKDYRIGGLGHYSLALAVGVCALQAWWAYGSAEKPEPTSPSRYP